MLYHLSNLKKEQLKGIHDIHDIHAHGECI